MTIDESLKELASQQYPHQVDVVDAVMSQVRQHPYLRPVKRMRVWQQALSVAVAAAIVALVVNVVVVNMQAYDETGIGNMISQVHSYDYYGSSIEEYAPNPIEYLYEE